MRSNVEVHDICANEFNCKNIFRLDNTKDAYYMLSFAMILLLLVLQSHCVYALGQKRQLHAA